MVEETVLIIRRPLRGPKYKFNLEYQSHDSAFSESKAEANRSFPSFL